MTKFLFTLFLLIFSFSYSQGWKFLFEKNNESFFYKPNTKNTAWIKVFSEKTEYYLKNIVNVQVTEGYTLTLWKFDCKEKKITPLQINVYSKTGGLLQSVHKDESSLDTTYVIPESVGEGCLNAFCSKEN